MKERRLDKFAKKNGYDFCAFTLSGASVPIQQGFERTINTNTLTKSEYNLLYNSGDFAEAFLFGSTLSITSRLLFPNVSPVVRLAATTGLSAGLLVGMETIQFHPPLSYVTGAADLKDLPAGFIGLGAYALGAIINEYIVNPQGRRR